MVIKTNGWEVVDIESDDPVYPLAELQEQLRYFVVHVASVTAEVLKREDMVGSAEGAVLRADVAFQVGSALCELNRLERVLLGVGTSVHGGNIGGGHQDLSHALQDLRGM